ncbi:hypothetical protein [Paenibacillus sp. MSJ-34]|uniref:hypothetical protein n=1 Tax=Paenibacillus sp. MSJ-34 TaxID=2841529 RepID=UPI00209D4E83|nr:hypothetical protein [Paenibacillus sp. MSJ-34]
MKNQHVKKVSVLALAGFICAAGVVMPQVSLAKQTTSSTKVVTKQTPKTLPEVKIGQKLIVPELELKENTYVLDYKKSDVNGDSVKDNVILAGTKEMIDGKLDAYASDLSIIVQDGKTRKYVQYDWKTKGIDGTWNGAFGREPNLIIGDYTGNKVDDMIVTAPQGGNGGYVNHLVVAWEENKLKAVFDDHQEFSANPGANFSFTPPASWSGHYKMKQFGGADADKMMPSAKHVVQFDYMTKGGKDTETLLMISVFAKNDWTRLSSEEGTPAGSVIAEANGLVYVYTTPQSNPFDPQSEDGKWFDQLYSDLDMKKSFALLK